MKLSRIGSEVNGGFGRKTQISPPHSEASSVVTAFGFKKLE